jgi:hypothetical protein
VAVVTAVGRSTLVAALIRDGAFPPKSNVLRSEPHGSYRGGDAAYALAAGDDDDDAEAGVSLVARDVLT